MNYASSSVGAVLVDWSSETISGEAVNVLDDRSDRIWLSKSGSPQWLCISMVNMKEASQVVIRTVGWYCWHSYITNPRIVSMHVSTDGSKFRYWDTFTAKSQSRGNQLFSCAPVDTSLYPFVAFEITQTFGGTQTYMNRIYLYSAEVTASPTSSTGSVHRVTETEGDSMTSTSEIHSPPLPINMSDLSYLTAEHTPPPEPVIEQRSIGVGMSQDTDAIVQQLQRALGITAEEDDEDDDSLSEVGSKRLAPAYRVDEQNDSVTVAGRVAALEDAVINMGQIVAHFSRSNSPERRASSVSVHSSLATPLQPSSHHPESSHTTSSASPNRNSPEQSTDRKRALLSEYENRMTRLENKLDHIVQAVLARDSPNASPPSGRPPPPPHPLPLHSGFEPSNKIISTPAHAALAQQGWSNSNTLNTSISNVTSISQGQVRQNSGSDSSLARNINLQPPLSKEPDLDSSSKTGESIKQIEHMLRYVLGDAAVRAEKSPDSSSKRRDQERTNKEDESYGSHATNGRHGGSVYSKGVKRLAQQRRYTSNNGREAGRGTDRHGKYASKLRNNSREGSNSSDQDYVSEKGGVKDVKKRFGVREYVSNDADSIVSEGYIRSIVKEAARFAAEPSHHNYHVPQYHLNRQFDQHDAHFRTNRTTQDLHDDDSSSDSSESNIRSRDRQNDSNTALDKNIFDLLKMKYGLQVSEGDALSTACRTSSSGDVRAHKSTIQFKEGNLTLPMRMAAEADAVGESRYGNSTVVDWSQYVINRVDSRSASPTAPKSPLRPGTPGVYTVAGVVVNSTDNIDVLARAKQHERNTRRTRGKNNLQYAKLSEGSQSGDKSPSYFVDSSSASTMGKNEALVAEDNEIATLVKTLHNKVYERTIKEAQYDILMMNERNKL